MKKTDIRQEQFAAQRGCPDSYKKAQDLYERALAILKHERGSDFVLTTELALLHYGFHLIGRDGKDENLGPDWDLVASAAKKATAGLGIKQDEIRLCAQPLGEAGGVDGTD